MYNFHLRLYNISHYNGNNRFLYFETSYQYVDRPNCRDAGALEVIYMLYLGLMT